MTQPTVVLSVGENEVELQTTNKFIIDKVKFLLSAKYDSYQYMQESKKGFSGYYFAFKINKNTFPIGLIYRVLGFFKSSGIQYQINLNIDKPAMDENFKYKDFVEQYGLDFRPFQEEIIENIKKRKLMIGIVEAPTGAGKTTTMLALTRLFTGKILIITISKDILDQFKKDFLKLKLNNDVCIVSGTLDQTKFKGDKARIFLCNYQSIHKLNIKEFDVVIIDEVQSSRSTTVYSFMKKVKTKARIGFSFTPFHLDDVSKLKIEGCFGTVIYTVPYKDLQKQNILAQEEIIFIDNKMDDISSFDWREIEDICIINNEKRNQLIVKIAKHYMAKGKSVLILTARIDQGQILNNLIENSEFICGENKQEIRNHVKVTLNNKKLSCLIANRIFDTGVDIPNLDIIINAAALKSFVRTIQSFGRGLRKGDANKSVYTYIDFMDSFNPILYRQSKERIKNFKIKGFETKKFDEHFLES